MRTRPITFLTDYGSNDEFAGVCRAVIARIAPDAPLIDITHGIRRHDVVQGAVVLSDALAYAPAGIHLAVVDPGVGSDRRAVAVRAGDEERLLVGPDNGLLEPAIERCGGAVEAFEISRSPVRLTPVSPTFHGRDVFAPVAAHLALGTPPGALGAPLDPGELVTLELRQAEVESGRLVAVVSHADGFGNVTLLAAGEQAADAGLKPGDPLAVEAAGGRHEATYALTFSDRTAGELLLYTDSAGRLALAVNGASATERLGIAGGDRVALRPA